jgi:hypothetical protein
MHTHRFGRKLKLPSTIAIKHEIRKLMFEDSVKKAEAGAMGRNNSNPGIDFGSDDKKGVVPEALGKLRPFSDFMLHDIGTGDGIVQTQDAQCPARGAQRFLQQAQQAPEIQWLQQAPAEADRCVVHIGARPFGSAYEHHGGKFRRHKSKWRARARWEDRKYDSNGPALGTACATAVAALTTEEAILRHSRVGSISRLSTC